MIIQWNQQRTLVGFALVTMWAGAGAPVEVDVPNGFVFRSGTHGVNPTLQRSMGSTRPDLLRNH